jgi:hypothetical protein
VNKKISSLFLLLFFVFKISFAQNETYKPLRITDNIILDGKLDEAVWQQAEAKDDFMQTDPVSGAAPTEKTEVKILYNDDFMFVGIRCFDAEPNKLIANALERDFSVGNEDGLAFVIDTYHDKSTGLAFITNLLNARWDEEFSSNGDSENNSYNTYWDVANHVDEKGYTTEFRIPFSSLRFEAKEKVTMAFRIVRLIKRKNELCIYPKCDPKINNPLFKISSGCEMEFHDLKSRKPFYITPYVIANYAEEKTLNAEGTSYQKQSEFLTHKGYAKDETLDKILSNIGMDIKYGLSKNFTLDLTANTDFAQAEVDNRIINLSKYEVNLPEKRSFFLESRSALSYGLLSGDDLFISRRIGKENGLIVPIIGGARITGKSNGWQLGMLNMQTTSMPDEGIAAHNFFVFRTRKSIDDKGSLAGGIFTNRINFDSTNSSNQSLGLSITKKIDEHLSYLLAAAGTTTDFIAESFSKSYYYEGGFFKSAREGVTFSATSDLIGNEFNPAMGFNSENDLSNSHIDIGYHWKASENSKAQYWYVNSNARYKWKPYLQEEENQFVNGEAGVNFKSGANIDLTPFEYNSDVLFEDWNIESDIVIPMGKYKMFTPDFDLSGPEKSNYSASISCKLGDFYGGNRISLEPSLTYTFSKHFKTGIDYEYNRIKFPDSFSETQHGLFESNLVSANIAYFFSSKLSVKILTQYEDLSNQITSNLRIRYNPREGTDLYIVINQGLNTMRERMEPHLPFVNAQAVTVKYLRTFAL